MTTDTQTKRPDSIHTDEDKFSHVVTKDDQMAGYIEGKEVQALCGYRFIPSRDPENLPVCPQCQMIRQNIGARGQN